MKHSERSDLTEVQRSVYEFMLGYFRREHSWPSMAEIAEHFGRSSPNSANEAVQQLIRKGWLERPRRGANRHYRIPGVELVFRATDAA
jgi:SOS-response transcriptional repressor LexA